MGDTKGTIALQQCDPSKPIIHIRSRDDHRHHQPPSIDPDMSLAPCACLVPVTTDVLGWRRRLEALALRTARGRYGQPSVALPFPLAQRFHHTLPDPRQPPAAQGAIDRVSMAEAVGIIRHWHPIWLT